MSETAVMLVFGLDHRSVLLLFELKKNYELFVRDQSMAVVEAVNFLGLYISNIVSHGQVINRRTSYRVNSVCVVF